MARKRKWKLNDENKMGVRYFAAAFLILTMVFSGIGIGVNKLGQISVFTEEEDPEVEERFELHSIVDAESPFFEAFTDRQKVNVLLVGINGGLTDTIMLACFDMDEKRVDLVSVPRDTYYVREGYNHPAEKKINAAYHKDVNNTAEAVSDLLMGIPIHYYAVIEFDGVRNIVDDMGGIPMNVPIYMRYEDPKDTPPLHIDVPPGQQVLNGEKAVEFLRYRRGNVSGYPKGYPDMDIGRIKAQQEFMKSAFKQSVANLPKVVKSVHENVKSNINLDIAVKMAMKGIGMSGEEINAYLLPGEGIYDTLSYWKPHEEEVEAIIKKIYDMEEETTTEGAVTSGEALAE